MNLVCEFSCVLAVDCVRVKQGAEGFEIGLLLQQRDKVVSVAGEARRNNFPDLSFDIIRLENTT